MGKILLLLFNILFNSFLGNSVLFIPYLSEDYATFMGHIHTTEEVRQSYQIEEVFYVIDMPQKLKVRIE